MNLIRHRVAFFFILLSAFSFIFPMVSVAVEASGGQAAASAAPASENQDARTNAEEGGYTAEATEAKAIVDQLVAAIPGVQAAGVLFPNMPQIQKFTEAITYYARFHGACIKTQSTASWLCREKTSPQLQSSLNQINTLMGMASGMVVKDACSNFAKAMKLAQAGLTAYTAACSAARAACEGACTTVNTNLKRFSAIKMPVAFKCIPQQSLHDAVTGALDALDRQVALKALADAQLACSTFTESVIATEAKVTALATKENSLPDKQSIASKDKACTYEYGQMIMSAGMGILSVANSIKQGQECDKQTDGTGEKPEDKKEKCDDPANASLPECICRANPRTPGCSNAYQKPGESSATQLSAATLSGRGPSGERGGPNLIGGLPPGEMPEAKAGGEGAGGGVGAPSGGGSAGLGGSGGGFGKGSGKEEAAKKGLDANIIGSGGGGGGGGGWGGAGSSGAGDRYRAYLPGGAKDPNKGLAGQQSWRNEVTGQGGKSNWEKVKDRYRDNKNTLLNN